MRARSVARILVATVLLSSCAAHRAPAQTAALRAQPVADAGNPRTPLTRDTGTNHPAVDVPALDEGAPQPLRPEVLPPPVPPEPEATRVRWPLLWATVISTGVVAGAAMNALLDNPASGFNVAHEGWFGEHTYVGGADKVSHFVSFEILARELEAAYGFLGFSAERSRLAGCAVSMLAGLTVELGDGTNKYGFAYEDLVMDALGVGTAYLTSVTNTRDLVGFRVGKVPGPVPPRAVDGLGRDYSYEIYTADLKLAGIARRLGVEIGPARFLLASITYGVKGYPYGALDQRERQLGFEVGLNFGEMLEAVHVHRDTWWGLVSHVLIDNFRIPYTAGGFRYDLNHHDLRGPDTGNSCGECP